MIFFPSREVAVEILGFSVHWYGIMYMLAFLFAYVSLPGLLHYRSLRMRDEDVSALVTAGILGVLIGGRLGYVFFYAPLYFLAHPMEVLAVWHGGMSSHGGFIGVGLALWIVLQKRSIPILPFLDVITVPVAVGLMLGRFGNFINLELYGVATTLPWAIEIPGVEGLRHPTQIYAMIKDALIAVICFMHLRQPMKRPDGLTFAYFLIFYGLLRFLVEFFRVETVESWTIGELTLTQGQALTIPIIVFGLVLYRWLLRREFS